MVTGILIRSLKPFIDTPLELSRKKTSMVLSLIILAILQREFIKIESFKAHQFSISYKLSKSLLFTDCLIFKNSSQGSFG